MTWCIYSIVLIKHFNVVIIGWKLDVYITFYSGAYVFTCKPHLIVDFFPNVFLSQKSTYYYKLHNRTSIEGDGNEIQAALAEWTNQKTVPNVFIGGKHIGGSDGMLQSLKPSHYITLLL